MDRSLGGPLPHQLANPTRAPPKAASLWPHQKARQHTVLAEVSLGCPVPRGRFPRVTHPSATDGPSEEKPSVRLACVRRAASVRPEPGSNSQIHLEPNGTGMSPHRPRAPDPGTFYTGRKRSPSIGHPKATRERKPPASAFKRRCTTTTTPSAHPLPIPTCQKNIPGGDIERPEFGEFPNF